MIDPRTKGRLQLILVGVFFIGPFLLAYVLYVTDSDWLPSSGTENGQLLDPPRLLPDTVLTPGSDTDGPGFRGKWSLIVVGRTQCAQACIDALYETRQVRRALGRDDARVQRVFFTGAGEPDSEFLEHEHPTLIVIEYGSQTGREMAPVLGEHAGVDILLADPLGNLVMRFPEGTGMKEMHKDLKHLLKISHIG